LMRTVQARIHSDIRAIIPLLSGAQPSGALQSGEKGQTPKATLVEQENQPRQSLRSWIADQPQPGGARLGQFQSGGGLALIRIHDITSQLAAELGASVEAPHLAGAS